MDTDRDRTESSNNEFTLSFLELFKEYKHRVLLSRVFLIFAFTFYALGVVFMVLFSPISIVFFIFGYFFSYISKNHNSVAQKAEQFILIICKG